MDSLSSPIVVCRPAIKRDYEDVKEFCKTIWNGHDYVPMVWGDWFKDPHGFFATAEYKGHAIGCAKVTLLSESQWWFEGFRVDPSYQGLKIGSHIHSYIDQWWVKNGDGVARLMTNAKNLHVQHLCNKLGFEKVGEALGFIAEPLNEEVNTFELTNDIKQFAAFARASESIKSMNQLVDFGWRIAELNESSLSSFSRVDKDFGQKLYWWKDRQGLFATWEDDDDGAPVLGVSVVACDMKDMSALLMDIRRMAAKGNYKNVLWIMNTFPQIFPVLEESGYQQKWENVGVVFEKRSRAGG